MDQDIVKDEMVDVLLPITTRESGMSERHYFVKYFSSKKWQYAKLHFPLLYYKDSLYAYGWACSNGKVWYNSDRRLLTSDLIACQEDEAMNSI